MRSCVFGVSPAATVMIPDRRTLWRLVLDPEVGLGDAYADGRIHIDGDLVRVLEAVYEAAATAPAYGSLYSRLASKWMDFRQFNSLRGSRHNIHRHYDIGNDFYKLWKKTDALHLHFDFFCECRNSGQSKTQTQ